VSVLLLGVNFLREQRWGLIVLVAYLLVFGGAFLAGGASAEDFSVLLRSLGSYGIAFAGLMAASALHNERRTRRVLSVLSKGITRAEYLAGALCGIMLALGIYSVGLGAMGTWGALRIHAPVVPSWELAGLFMLAFLMAASVGQFFSTFLHPMLAVSAAALLLSAEVLLGSRAEAAMQPLIPGYAIYLSLLQFSPAAISISVQTILMAFAHAAAFWIASCIVFSVRDVSAAVE
jgi:hypothetical protein